MFPFVGIHRITHVVIILSDLHPLINTVNMGKSYVGESRSQLNLLIYLIGSLQSTIIFT